MATYCNKYSCFRMSYEKESNKKQSYNKSQSDLSYSDVSSSLQDRDIDSAWCYLFIRRSRSRIIIDKLKENFSVFIHKTVIHTNGKGRIVENLRPTISGLVFVQGRSDVIQKFLNENFQGLYLVKDCSTGKPAIIKDSVMSSFIQVSYINPSRLRFMPHSFDYYSSGHTLVKVVSGVLAGLEGYIVRISRDKCLVTSMGGMTVAIKGISKETFENVAEYLSMRKKEQSEYSQLSEVEGDSVFISDLKRCFIIPESRVDILAMAGSLDKWILKAEYQILTGNLIDSSEMLMFMIDEIGKCIFAIYDKFKKDMYKELETLCSDALGLLMSIVGNSDISENLKSYINNGLDKIREKHPYLPLSPVPIDSNL